MYRPQPGDAIGQYVLLERIGSGTFGEVFRAEHRSLGTVVAVKVPTDALYVRNLQREARVVHGLHHPNIVRVLDLDAYGEVPHLVMEYVDGPSLATVLREWEEGLPLRAVWHILVGMLRALHAAHSAGVIHRDIKPANVLLRGGKDPERLRPGDVKVTDFGLGRATEDTRASLMQSGSLRTAEGRNIAGTVAYMAPEQLEGEAVDVRADLYAVGVVLFEMLTGRRPQGADGPGTLRPGLPAVFDEMFRRCYTRRERRYGSALEMLQVLSAHRSVGPSDALPPTRAAEGLRCAACGEAVEAGDQFCGRCGTQLVAIVRRCRQCGGYAEREDRYCVFCGSRLPGVVPAARELVGQ